MYVHVSVHVSVYVDVHLIGGHVIVTAVSPRRRDNERWQRPELQRVRRPRLSGDHGGLTHGRKHGGSAVGGKCGKSAADTSCKRARTSTRMSSRNCSSSECSALGNELIINGSSAVRVYSMVMTIVGIIAEITKFCGLQRPPREQD